MSDLACTRPTAKYPDGRTGLRAGYLAHWKAKEEPCAPCREAHTAHGRDRWANLTPDQKADRREKNRAEAERFRANSPELVEANSRRYRDINRSIIREAKSKPCADCGVSYPYYVMQFDHLGDKKFNIGAIGPTASRKRLLAEIAKCDVVCANCHAERSYQRMQSGEACA
ncbi:hypothetical protein B7C42_01639 [Nocardia cerradoensis]|uniref:HNH domain-containing protein n=1 Tax=Nocardia cerradoensis TaxID=85688 RepID=A0A231HCM8_9NOCA|nr:hypothetical protein [Nocardia cerradoensis]OXR46664.1 hypothetical protein B7C42_01639 [Nocardia cerradoensis]